MKSIDVKTAYLQGARIEREVYLKPVEEANTDKIWRLKKTGLKDPSWSWYRNVEGYLQDLGGVRSNFNPTIFIWRTNKTLKDIMCSYLDIFFYEGDEDFERDVRSGESDEGRVLRASLVLLSERRRVEKKEKKMFFSRTGFI